MPKRMRSRAMLVGLTLIKKKEGQMNDIEKRIEEIVWYLFRKYDVKNSGYELKIQKIVDYCMDDLQKHPDVNDS